MSQTSLEEIKQALCENRFLTDKYIEEIEKENAKLKEQVSKLTEERTVRYNPVCEYHDDGYPVATMVSVPNGKYFKVVEETKEVSQEK